MMGLCSICGAMLRLLITFFLTLYALPLLAACPPASLQQAYFSLSPSSSGKIGATLDTKQITAPVTLYFFSKIQNNTTGVTLHRWMHNQHRVKTVSLASQSGSWQGWSADHLPSSAGGTWQVVVLDKNQCVLGKVTLDVPKTYPVMTKAKQQLEKGDVLGAKLTLKAALKRNGATSQQKSRWQQFLATKLVLAEAAQDIDQHQFLAAAGRLQSLQGKLEEPLEITRKTLLKELAETRTAAENSQLHGLIAAISVLSIANTCPTTSAAATAQLSRLLPSQTVRIQQYQPNDTNARVTATLVGGKTVNLQWPCRPLWEGMKTTKSQTLLASP